MSLYYITGISGAGKSTILTELRLRGYEAYDVDELGPVTAKWHNDKTGFIHPKSSVKKEDRTPDFLATHSWKITHEEVAGLAKQATAKTIFLGGSVTIEPEIRDLFSTVFSLTLDDETLERRLATRTNNDWGKNPHELAQALAANHELAIRHKDLGYTLIDARQEPEIIVATILSHLHDNNE